MKKKSYMKPILIPMWCPIQSLLIVAIAEEML